MKVDENGFKWMKMDEVDVSGKHRHRRNVTRYHFFDYYNFHQQATSNLPSLDNFHQSTTFINRQLSPIDNIHQQTPFITSLAIITFIKRQLPSLDNFPQKTTFIKRQLPSLNSFHQNTNFTKRQLSFALIDNFHPHSPESHQSSLQKASSHTRVTSIKSS